MKKLFTILLCTLTTSSAFAMERGNTTVDVKDALKIATIKLEGSAAASLYDFLGVNERQSKARPGFLVKNGGNITCYMGYKTLGRDMISPVVQFYECSLLVSANGNIEADGEVSIND